MGSTARSGYAVLTAAALAAAASAPGALAQEGKFYVGLNVPVMFIDDTESTTTGAQLGFDPAAPATRSPYTAKATSEYDTGFKVAGTVGYHLGAGLRVEGELFFARAEVAKLTYRGVTAMGQGVPLSSVNIDVEGTADQLGGMANVWYDIDTGTEWMPFIGGGIGFIRVDQGDLDYDSNGLANAIATVRARSQDPQAPEVKLPAGTIPDISTTDTVFAYHFGAGVGYRLNPNVVLQVGYRLQAAADLEFSGSNPMGTVDVESTLRAHLIEIGVRYNF